MLPVGKVEKRNLIPSLPSCSYSLFSVQYN